MLMYDTSICQCRCAASGCSKPVPFFDGLPFHLDKSPACPKTRHTLVGLVALQRVLEMKADDGLLLPILQPEVAGNPAVVLVHLPVAFPPVVELAGGDVEPPRSLLRPAPDEIHGLIPRIVRNPISSFGATCSTISSART